MLVQRHVAPTVVAVVHEDEIDVGAGIELEAAELAHAEDDQPRSAAVGATRLAVPLGDVIGGFANCDLERRVREEAELAGGALELRAAELDGQELTQGDARLFFPDGAAQGGQRIERARGAGSVERIT